MKRKILIVEDEFVEANYLEVILVRAGYDVVGIARSVNIALKMLGEHVIDLVFVDIFLKGSLTGVHLGHMLREKGVAFVFISANSNRETLESAKVTRPYGFIVKPFREKDVLVMLEIALHLHDQKTEPGGRKRESGGRTAKGTSSGLSLNGIVGESRKLQAVMQELRMVAPTDISVLILGETGTGKERAVEMLHSLSNRGKGPLVKVNCAALPESLIESILFGHEKGAFTGANEKKKGKFEQAQGGTLFLDEIGELTADLQVKLLRVLQEKEVELIGGEQTIPVDCRIVAATNRNLTADVASGRFRMDLFYRLNVFPLTLPPLRERKEDIPLLARHFVDYYSKRMGKLVPKILPSVLEDLKRYNWPGNIRELEHAMERAVLLAHGDTIRKVITSSDLAEDWQPAAGTQSLEELEKDHIIEVLKQCDGKVSGKGGAAELLKIHASTLNSRIRKLGIKKLRNITR